MISTVGLINVLASRLFASSAAPPFVPFVNSCSTGGDLTFGWPAPH